MHPQVWKLYWLRSPSPTQGVALPILSSGVPLLSVLVASSDLFLKVELVIPAPTKVIQQLGASPLLASIYALRSSY